MAIIIPKKTVNASLPAHHPRVVSVGCVRAFPSQSLRLCQSAHRQKNTNNTLHKHQMDAHPHVNPGTFTAATRSITPPHYAILAQ